MYHTGVLRGTESAVNGLMLRTSNAARVVLKYGNAACSNTAHAPLPRYRPEKRHVSTQAPSLTSPEAPFGLTPIDPTLRADANGRQFTQLIEGPFTLSEPAPGDERYFAPAAFPDWSGRGVSFTMWYAPLGLVVSRLSEFALQAFAARAWRCAVGLRTLCFRSVPFIH